MVSCVCSFLDKCPLLSRGQKVEDDQRRLRIKYNGEDKKSKLIKDACTISRTALAAGRRELNRHSNLPLLLKAKHEELNALPDEASLTEA